MRAAFFISFTQKFAKSTFLICVCQKKVVLLQTQKSVNSYLSATDNNQNKQYMKKRFILFFACFMSLNVMAQEYTVISRNNDTIKLYPNLLGKAIKALVPGTSTEAPPEYRLIKKVQDGKESYLYVEFSKQIEKLFVAYETDMITPGKWDVHIYTAGDVYKCMHRVNAILLQGEIMGMPIEIYQRPANFQDRISIDNVEFSMPIKVAVIEGVEEEVDNTKSNKDNKSSKADDSKKAKKEEKKTESKSTESKPTGPQPQPEPTQTEKTVSQPQPAPKAAEPAPKPKEVINVKEPTNSIEQRNANDGYIAYLVKSHRFNHASDEALINELCDNSHIAQLLRQYDIEDLEKLGTYHDPRLEACILQ